MYIYHYRRHLSDHQEDFDTLRDAIVRAATDVDLGAAWPVRVEKDGVTVLEQQALLEKVNEMLDKLYARGGER